MKKRNPQDSTRRNVQAANKKLKIHDQRIAELTKRVDVIESLIDRGLGKFRTP